MTPSSAEKEAYQQSRTCHAPRNRYLTEVGSWVGVCRFLGWNPPVFVLVPASSRAANHQLGLL